MKAKKTPRATHMEGIEFVRWLGVGDAREERPGRVGAVAHRLAGDFQPTRPKPSSSPPMTNGRSRSAQFAARYRLHRKRAPMRKVLLVIGMTQNAIVMLLRALPALTIYVLFLGMIALDFRDGNTDPYFTIPG
jgi:hypothetical protein